jgi:hypothetical protein
MPLTALNAILTHHHDYLGSIFFLLFHPKDRERWGRIHAIRDGALKGGWTRRLINPISAFQNTLRRHSFFSILSLQRYSEEP